MLMESLFARSTSILSSTNERDDEQGMPKRGMADGFSHESGFLLDGYWRYRVTEGVVYAHHLNKMAAVKKLHA